MRTNRSKEANKEVAARTPVGFAGDGNAQRVRSLQTQAGSSVDTVAEERLGDGVEDTGSIDGERRDDENPRS